MKLQPWIPSSNRVWPLRQRSLAHKLPRSIVSVRRFSAPTTDRYSSLDCLQDDRVDTFRQQCFIPEQPAILPRSSFRDLPALTTWFQPAPTTARSVIRLNTEYLQSHAADAFVPLELTESTPSKDALNKATSSPQSAAPGIASFRKFHAPLTLFLDWMSLAETTSQSSRLYLAQCQLLDLPSILRQDFPTPALVRHAGKGDVYDTNVWIGHPPTYTPLHRDPNPNLFVQLAGQKMVRLLAPADGQTVFSAVRRQLGKSGSKDAAAFRGEEMMHGQERAFLDDMVWGNPISSGATDWIGYEAHLKAGDGLFIPKGWWHSIKGVGEGVTASVSDSTHSQQTSSNLTTCIATGQLVVPINKKGASNQTDPSRRKM